MSGKGSKRLVIVESPTKAKTIRRFLPSGYQVEASMGHVRDLPASAAEIPKDVKSQPWARLGVNPDENFMPLYIVPSKKKKVVNQLKMALKDASELYIATDEDREGESIGWHLLEVLNPKVPVKRMVFHEITEDAIRNALEATRDIDHNLVDAQETRRILDRFVGYSISPLLWKKIAPKLSAGRVQSVAVRLLVMREKDRLAFVPASYWDMKAMLAKLGEANSGENSRAFESVLTKLSGVRLATGKDFAEETGKLKTTLTAGENVIVLSEDDAKRLAEELKNAAWQVAKVDTRQSKRSPAPPFTTSTLQQEASRKLNMSAKETMRVAQGLYENGYITYMRTDSTNLSQEAISASRQAVTRRYGEDYLSDKPRQFKTKSRNAQEAHEAIRPAGTDMKTADEHKLSGVEARLYDLIWKRTVATQMAEARLQLVTVHIDAKGQNAAGQTIEATFRASGRTTVFAGFFRAYVEGSDDPDAALDEREQPLPDLTEGDALNCSSLTPLGHETKPPARFTEASLVKLLEQEGIGRHSTYASIIDTVMRRGYVRKQGSQLIPTFTAFATNNLLEHQFQQLVDTSFTADMEQILDDIATGELPARPYLEAFYKGKGDDEGLVERVEEGLESVDARAVSTLKFAKWGDYLVRVGRYGPYVEGEIDGETVTASVPPEYAPADIDAQMLEQLLTAGNAGDVSFGEHPDTGREMLLKRGPYGPYLEMETDDKKPKRTSLPKGVEPADVTRELATSLLNLPRTVGNHPDTGKPITVQIGRFGPYAKHGSTSASLGKDDDLLTVGFERVLDIIQKKEAKNKPLRTVADHPETGDPITIKAGRYGPYVEHQKTKVSLPKDQDVDKLIETLELEDALALLATKEGTKRKTKASKAKASKKTSKKKTSKKKTSKTSKQPKASPRDLEPFLAELDDNVRAVVARVEGMAGNDPQDMATIADSLGLKEEDVQAAHKRGMFKLRMAYGKARKANAANSAEAA
jgi:DNA topoisomerase-1